MHEIADFWLMNILPERKLRPWLRLDSILYSMVYFKIFTFHYVSYYLARRGSMAQELNPLARHYSEYKVRHMEAVD